MSSRRKPKKKRSNPLPGRQHPPLPAAQRTQSVTVNHASFSGPLPPPAMLERYNQILPDGANRIVSLVEKQQIHRHKLEEAVVTGEIALARSGQRFAAGLSILGLVAGTLLVYSGQSGAGLTVITTFVVSLAGLFLKAQKERREERQRRDDLNRQLSQ